MRRGAKVTLIGGVFTVMAAGAGFSAWSLLGGDAADADDRPVAASSGPPSATEIEDTAKEFLAAWAKGDADTAATYTNDADKAFPMLGVYDKVELTAGRAAGAEVPFRAKATVTHEGHSKTLSYDSQLKVVRGVQSGRALVDWAPSVVHPKMSKGDTLELGEAPAPPIEAVDRDGKKLAPGDYPSLKPVLDSLRERYGDKAGGKPGTELWIKRGDNRPDETLLTLDKGRPGTLRTTLSAAAQTAAEKAVRGADESSVVAVKPSTGEVLAVANHRDDAFNAAFLGRLAPGSTMKVVSAALLIDKGLTKADGAAPCPDSAVWQSQRFGNLTGMKPNEKATLSESFARSCNTSFVKFADDLRPEDLTDEARKHFGIGADWKTGIVSFDGRIPAAGGPDTAAALLGQGQVQMNPLTMASVSATVKAGAFRQPILVPRDLDDRQLATAEPLPASTAEQLRQMMRRTAVSGTGAGAMAKSGGGDIGAKTGSAEVDGQEKSDSWFTGFRGDVAAAAVAQRGGHGGDAAGPIVAAVLAAGG